jgi:hypothetical protein
MHPPSKECSGSQNPAKDTIPPAAFIKNPKENPAAQMKEHLVEYVADNSHLMMLCTRLGTNEIMVVSGAVPFEKTDSIGSTGNWRTFWLTT